MSLSIKDAEEGNNTHGGIRTKLLGTANCLTSHTEPCDPSTPGLSQRNKLIHFIAIFLLAHTVFWLVIRNFDRKHELSMRWESFCNDNISNDWIRWLTTTTFSLGLIENLSAALEIRIVDRIVARWRDALPWSAAAEKKQWHE